MPRIVVALCIYCASFDWLYVSGATDVNKDDEITLGSQILDNVTEYNQMYFTDRVYLLRSETAEQFEIMSGTVDDLESETEMGLNEMKSNFLRYSDDLIRTVPENTTACEAISSDDVESLHIEHAQKASTCFNTVRGLIALWFAQLDDADLKFANATRTIRSAVINFKETGYYESGVRFLNWMYNWRYEEFTDFVTRVGVKSSIVSPSIYNCDKTKLFGDQLSIYKAAYADCMIESI